MPKQPTLTNIDRLLFVWLYRWFPSTAGTLAIVRPETDQPELSPRELAIRFMDTKMYFVSEASAYRLLKAQDLIASPTFIVIKAANECKDKTTPPNHLRYHKSIAHLTPADVYFGCVQTILLERERIKRNTIQNRHLNYRRIAA
jgi:hypothetical protein